MQSDSTIIPGMPADGLSDVSLTPSAPECTATPPQSFSGVAVGGPALLPVPPSPENIVDLELNIRIGFNTFSLTTVESVAYVIKALFSDGVGLILRPLGGRGIGIYKIQLTTPIECVSFMTAKFHRESKDGTPSEPILIPITVPPPRHPRGYPMGRRQGTLITIVNSASDVHRSLPNSLFDDGMQEQGEVVKPTELQKLRETYLFNGNRYLLIDPAGKGNIPAAISATDPLTNLTHQFYLRYKGQSWFCRRCDDRYVGPCVSLQTFNAAKDVRAKEEIVTKIASDSNLRCAEQVGLCASTPFRCGLCGDIIGRRMIFRIIFGSTPSTTTLSIPRAVAYWRHSLD